MIFENLSDRLQGIFKKLRGHGKLTEDDVSDAMREVRMALLEADVNFKVVKDFVKRVKERAVGQEVLDTLTAAQAVIKIVDEELTALMGGTESRLNISPNPPTVIMLVGLQGSGKTTSAGKLALMLKKQGKRPLLVADDIYRPAAIKQLEVIGEKVEVPVFSQGQEDAVAIARAAIGHSASHANDVVIIDTAGRLQIDETLMQELCDIKAAVKPHEILLVVDAMTGQEAVNVAQAFDESLGLDGVIMTKLDGDARGGAALSIKAVTGCPVKFVGMGEKLEPLEVFHPDRMASRILGMGDVLSLVEKAQENFDLVVAFAASIRMIPVKVLKEQPGYLLNSMLVPFLSAAEGLWAGGVGSPEDIDRAWMIGTGAPAGPFRILDIIGLTTAYNVGMLNPKAQQEGTIENRIVTLLKEKIDAGELGINAGKGFYTYGK